MCDAIGFLGVRRVEPKQAKIAQIGQTGKGDDVAVPGSVSGVVLRKFVIVAVKSWDRTDVSSFLR